MPLASVRGQKMLRLSPGLFEIRIPDLYFYVDPEHRLRPLDDDVGAVIALRAICLVDEELPFAVHLGSYGWELGSANSLRSNSVSPLARRCASQSLQTSSRPNASGRKALQSS